jgi:hypothetical protein
MRRDRTSLRRRWRGALALGVFGAIVAGPLEYFHSGVGWNVLLALLVGAAAGSGVGFLFPSLLTPRQGKHATVLPPAPPPPRPPQGR